MIVIVLQIETIFLLLDRLDIFNLIVFPNKALSVLLSAVFFEKRRSEGAQAIA